MSTYLFVAVSISVTKSDCGDGRQSSLPSWADLLQPFADVAVTRNPLPTSNRLEQGSPANQTTLTIKVFE